MNIDRLVARFLPAVGITFLAWGLGYLTYTEIWPAVPHAVRIASGGFLGLVLLYIGLSAKLPSKFFSDAFASVGILTWYAALIYASRTDETFTALLPETGSLVVALVFSALASFLSVAKDSKTILLSALLGAYLAPFFIGNEDSWRYAVPYTGFLAYYLGVNVVLLVAGRKMDLSEIVPINGIALMVSSTFLRILGFSHGLDAQTATYALFLDFLIVLTFVAAMFRTEWANAKASERIAAFSWIAPALWFLGNALSFSHLVDSTTRAAMEILLAFVFFGVWHFLRASGKDGTGAYFSAGLLLCVGVVVFFLNDLHFAGLALSLSAGVMILLAVVNGKQNERIITGMAFATVGCLISAGSTLDMWDMGTVSRLKASLIVTLSLLPLLSLSFISKEGFSEEWKSAMEFGSISAWISLALLAFFNITLIDIDPLLLFFFLPCFFVAAVLAMFPIVEENARRLFKAAGFYVTLGAFFAIFPILELTFDRPALASFTSDANYYALFGTLTLGLLLWVGRRFQDEFTTLKALWIGYVFFAVNLMLVVLSNAMFSSTAEYGFRAVVTTIYWVAASIFCLWLGLTRKNSAMKKLGFAGVAFTILKVVFYDLSGASSSMKVAVLMVVGAAFLAFSWYATKNGLISEDGHEEEETPAVRAKTPTAPVEKSVPKASSEPLPSVNVRLAEFDLADISSAVVTPLGASAFKVNSKNLLKIMKLVVDTHGNRDVYMPGELLSIYDKIIKNYKSELPKSVYESVADTMKDFCKRGGSVSFK